jgi:hypothetical protein
MGLLNFVFPKAPANFSVEYRKLRLQNCSALLKPILLSYTSPTIALNECTSFKYKGMTALLIVKKNKK